MDGLYPRLAVTYTSFIAGGKLTDTTHSHPTDTDGLDVEVYMNQLFV